MERIKHLKRQGDLTNYKMFQPYESGFEIENDVPIFVSPSGIKVMRLLKRAAPAVKRERIIMDSLNGDFFI